MEMYCTPSDGFNLSRHKGWEHIALKNFTSSVFDILENNDNVA